MADPSEVEPGEDHETKPPAKNWRKILEDQAEAAEAKAAELARELAFTKAGLSDLSPKQVKALLAAHEGEVTADAIKATATELGFGAPAEVAADPEKATRETELAALSTVTGGAVPAPTGDANGSFKEQVENFEGDYQAFREFVMQNADAIIG